MTGYFAVSPIPIRNEQVEGYERDAIFPRPSAQIMLRDTIGAGASMFFYP
jgi:hypothetical protein